MRDWISALARDRRGLDELIADPTENAYNIANGGKLPLPFRLLVVWLGLASRQSHYAEVIAERPGSFAASTRDNHELGRASPHATPLRRSA